MGYIILTFLLTVNLFSTQAQERHFNLIISIDEKVEAGNIQDTYVILKSKKQIAEKFDVDYEPGDLSLSEELYDEISNEEEKEIYLHFSYTEYCGEEEKFYEYEIRFYKSWFENRFLLLYVYNTEKEKYKDIFDPKEGKTYNYEYSFPGSHARLITKKPREDRCK